MAATYKRRHGVDWPAGMADQFIDLVVAKKWREFREAYGVEFKDPWVPLLDAAKSLLSEEYFRVSEWTEQHFHDWVMYDKLITWGCASSSKALPENAGVMTASGVVPIGLINVGDRVLDADGSEVVVVGVRDQEDAPLYKVRFSDGVEIVCSEDHLWYGDCVVSFWDGERKRHLYTRKTFLKSAKELAAFSRSTFRSYSFRVPLPKPVSFKCRDVPLDPYVLGCLIGDGGLTDGVRLASDLKDAPLRDEFSRRLPPGYVLHRTSNVYNYVVVKEGRRARSNAVVAAVKALGLYGVTTECKFVPECYKYNSVAVRMDVLAGLFDTDGTVLPDGRIAFTSVSKSLVDDVVFLLESVGAFVTVTKQGARSYTRKSDGKTIRQRDVYKIYVHGLPLETAKRLFKLPRKRDRVVRREKGEGHRYIRSVEPVKARSTYPRRSRCLVLSSQNADGRPSNGLFMTDHFVVTHNSNDTALLLVLDWLVDPMDTVSLLGSTSKVDLKSRSWEAVVRYHSALKLCNRSQFLIPGKISKQGQALINEEDEESAASAGEKAGIQGRALNEDGRLQGAHALYVRLVVDELAAIANHEAIKVAMANLRVGTRSFKFIGLANPESWSNASCQYCIPEGGIESVNVDTGCWRSTFGAFVRHHDGFKSPCVLHPELRKVYPYLMSKEEIEQTIREADGNADAPQVWKMIRGFPTPSGDTAPVVLEESIAVRNHVTDPMDADPSRIVAVAAGIDPAWTEGGDGACRVRVRVVRDDFGRNILDFTGGLKYLKIMASDPRPPVQQMRDQVIADMRLPYEASFYNTAIDASGNQGLADDLMIYAGADCLAVNSSERASDNPIRANDTRPTKDSIYDRAAEAWCVLAEFCRAGQVRGLPAEALRALTLRRFASRPNSTSVAFPYRLEKKDDFKARVFKKSPDEADACALAALAVKERVGLPPFGYLVPPRPQALVSTELAKPGIMMPDVSDGSAQFEDDGYDSQYDDYD